MGECEKYGHRKSSSTPTGTERKMFAASDDDDDDDDGLVLELEVRFLLSAKALRAA